MVNLRIGSIVCHLFYPAGKPLGRQIPRWQGFAVDYYGCTLAALTLTPSDFCNNGGNPTLLVEKADDPSHAHILKPDGKIFFETNVCSSAS